MDSVNGVQVSPLVGDGARRTAVTALAAMLGIVGLTALLLMASPAEAADPVQVQILALDDVDFDGWDFDDLRIAGVGYDVYVNEDLIKSGETTVSGPGQTTNFPEDFGTADGGDLVVVCQDTLSDDYRFDSFVFIAETIDDPDHEDRPCVAVEIEESHFTAGYVRFGFLELGQTPVQIAALNDFDLDGWDFDDLRIAGVGFEVFVDGTTVANTATTFSGNGQTSNFPEDFGGAFEGETIVVCLDSLPAPRAFHSPVFIATVAADPDGAARPCFQRTVTAGDVSTTYVRFGFLTQIGTAPAVSISFHPTVSLPERPVELRIMINNAVNAVAVSNMAMQVDLPAGIVEVDPGSETSSCGPVSVSDDVVELTGGSLGAGAVCSISLDVKALAPAVYLRQPVALSTSFGASWSNSASLTISPGFCDGVLATHYVTPGYTFFGTSGVDIIYGTNDDDVIYAEEGSDRVCGLAGFDAIHGGDGNDRIFGGNDDDFAEGGLGNDTIYGGLGDDFLTGDDGIDRLFGQGGSDYLYGGPGDDRISAGSGGDMLYGDAGDDRLWGQADNDRVEGGDGDDLLYGGVGVDEMVGGAGDDTFYGQAGNDELFGGPGADLMYGSVGNDTIVGNEDNDRIFGQAGIDDLSGNDGADTLFGGGGVDQLNGGEGDDLLYGQGGNDFLEGGPDSDACNGGSGTDSASPSCEFTSSVP